MKIRIVKACYPTVWYANKIGEVFDATDCGTQYLLDNSLSAVYKEDCEEVLEPIEQPVQPSAPAYAEISELLHEAKEDKKKADDEALLTFLKSLPDDETNELKDIVTHNGKQYRKVKRKAAVGELVHVFGHVQKAANGIYEVERVVRFSGEDECIKYGGGWGTPYWDGNAYETLELVEQSGQSETLTERDLIANLAQEVAELKRQLNDAKTDIADLEDRLDESEKDTEEVIGRMNDLGDGAEAAAVVSAEAIEKVIAELDTLEEKALDEADTFNYNGMVEQYESEAEAKAYGKAIGLLKEALRNG